MSQSRFLFVVRGNEGYGTAQQALSLMRILVEMGYKVDLYAFGSGGFVDRVQKIAGVGVHIDHNEPRRFTGRGAARALTFSRTMLGSMKLTERLAAYLGSQAYSALVFCEHGLLLAIGRAARRNRVSAFWLMPNLVSGNYPLDLNRRIYGYAFKQYGVVPIANSTATLESLGRAARYAEKIDLGSDPEEFSLAPNPAPEDPAGPVRLLVMARMDEHKGQMLLLRAALSRPAFANIHLTFCGGPSASAYVDAIKSEIRQASADGRVALLGPIENPATQYVACDVVASTRLDAEPFGLTITEAMLVGKPVLTHALGGPKDIVVDGLTGWHINAPTVEAFAEGLERMLADRSRWREMGLAGRRRAEERYTLAKMTEAFLRVVDRHLAPHDTVKPDPASRQDDSSVLGVTPPS